MPFRPPPLETPPTPAIIHVKDLFTHSRSIRGNVRIAEEPDIFWPERSADIGDFPCSSRYEGFIEYPAISARCEVRMVRVLGRKNARFLRFETMI